MNTHTAVSIIYEIGRLITEQLQAHALYGKSWHVPKIIVTAGKRLDLYH